MLENCVVARGKTQTLELVPEFLETQNRHDLKFQGSPRWTQEAFITNHLGSALSRDQDSERSTWGAKVWHWYECGVTFNQVWI